MRYKFSQEEIEDICKRYEEGESSKKIGKDYHVCYGTILKILRKQKIQIRKSFESIRKIKGKDVNEICNMYIEGTNSNEIGKKYNVCGLTIRELLRENGVKIKSISKARQKYKVDEEFFDNIDTEEKAYWLGFLYADGCLYNGTLRLKLSFRDIKHLIEFKNALHSEHPIKEIFEDTNFSNHAHLCYLSIKNKHVSQTLLNYGYNDKNKFPWIDCSLKNHFIRGIFDGDGSVSSGKTYRKSDCTLKNYYRVEFLAKEKFLCEIQNTLVSEAGLSRTKLIRPHRTNNIYAMSYGGKGNFRKIYNYLYKDATVFLERKKAKFDSALKEEQNSLPQVVLPA